MKAKVLEKSNRKIKLDIKGLNPALVNMIRKISMTEVPVLAIKEAYFMENNSALFDELVAHRLGLIPLKFPDLAGHIPNVALSGEENRQYQ